MNKESDNEKEGVVIDVTPEPEQAQTGAAEPASDEASSGEDTPASDTRTQRSGGPAIIIALLSLLLVLVGAGFGYLQFSQLQQSVQTIEQRLGNSSRLTSELQQTIDQTRQALAEQRAQLEAQAAKLEAQTSAFERAQQQFQEQSQRLAEERTLLDQREAELRGLVADLHRRVGRSSTGWMVSEAEYLIRLANRRLQLARDVITARKALELADQRLRETGDPGWAGVREQLALDQAKLASLELPDITGLSARLTALEQQTEQLRISKGTLGGGKQAVIDKVSMRPEAERSWRTLLSDLWLSLKESVRLRRNDEPVQAMLPPEQQYFLVQNLQLQIEAARLALLRGDPKLYRDSLHTALNWLEQHFDLEAAPTRALRAGLSDLIGIDIRPPLPDISGSLRAMTARAQLLEQMPAAETATPATNTPAEPTS